MMVAMAIPARFKRKEGERSLAGFSATGRDCVGEVREDGKGINGRTENRKLKTR